MDYVLFSDSSVKAASNDQQWYVTTSRGRKGIRVFTRDKLRLRENIIRSGKRTLALELENINQQALPSKPREHKQQQRSYLEISRAIAKHH